MELKEVLKTIDIKEFLGEMNSSYISAYGNDGKKMGSVIEFLGTFPIGSPLKINKYLIGLIMSTEYSPDNEMFEKKKKKIKELVTKILSRYLHEIESEIFKEKKDKTKSLITMEAFTSYFDTEVLVYPEQINNYIEQFYKPFSDIILQKTGLEYNDYCLLIDLANKAAEEPPMKSAIESYLKFLELDHLPYEERMKYSLQSLSYKDLEPFSLFLDDLEEKFSKEKIEKILDYFVLKRCEREFLYYTGENPYNEKPLSQVGDGQYMVGLKGSIELSVYKFLEKIISSNSKLKNKKDKIVEEVFRKKLDTLFEGKAKIHVAVCEKKGTFEHDLLIEIDDYILLGEIKGSKIREGNRRVDVEGTYVKIRDHFNGDSGIGKGYNQAIKLRNLLKGKQKCELYYKNNNKKFLVDCEGKTILPIVLTLGQFGTIGINTSKLLKKEEFDPWPWVCNLHDLENICKIKDYLKIPYSNVLKYIEFRSLYHDRIYSGDELEIYEKFISENELEIKENEILICTPNPAGDLIDHIYFKEKKQSYEYSSNMKSILNLGEFCSSQHPIVKELKIGRNEKCSCGSGKKYKKCCGK